MALFQNGIDVSRYQGNINWGRVAAAGKQFAIVRVGSGNSGGLYVDPYFLQNVNGAKAAGLRVGAYYYTYARTRAAVANELTTFLNVMDGLQLEYPVFVDVEDSSLTSLGRAELTSLVQSRHGHSLPAQMVRRVVQLHKLYQQLPECRRAEPIPVWVADYRSALGYNAAMPCGSTQAAAAPAESPARATWTAATRTSCPRSEPEATTTMGSPVLLWRRSAASVWSCSTPGASILYRQLQRCGRLPAAGQLLCGKAEHTEI